MIFVPTIVNHTQPQVSVVAADSGVPPITYNQIKQSLGNQVYNVEEFYLFSTSLNQLLGTIQYNRYDVSGNQNYTTIATTVDPYQNQTAIFKKIDDYNDMFILNGNSSFATTILPLTYLQIKFISKRVTNSFGRNLTTFAEFEKIFRKPNFFNNYGSSISAIQETNKEIEDSIGSRNKKSLEGDNKVSNEIKIHKEDNSFSLLILSAVAGFIAFKLIKKNK